MVNYTILVEVRVDDFPLIIDRDILISVVSFRLESFVGLLNLVLSSLSGLRGDRLGVIFLGLWIRGNE